MNIPAPFQIARRSEYDIISLFLPAATKSVGVDAVKHSGDTSIGNWRSDSLREAYFFLFSAIGMPQKARKQRCQMTKL